MNKEGNYGSLRERCHTCQREIIVREVSVNNINQTYHHKNRKTKKRTCLRIIWPLVKRINHNRPFIELLNTPLTYETGNQIKQSPSKIKMYYLSSSP